jgi:hypothetical protein
MPFLVEKGNSLLGLRQRLPLTGTSSNSNWVEPHRFKDSNNTRELSRYGLCPCRSIRLIDRHLRQYVHRFMTFCYLSHPSLEVVTIAIVHSSQATIAGRSRGQRAVPSSFPGLVIGILILIEGDPRCVIWSRLTWWKIGRFPSPVKQG